MASSCVMARGSVIGNRVRYRPKAGLDGQRILAIDRLLPSGAGQQRPHLGASGAKGQGQLGLVEGHLLAAAAQLRRQVQRLERIAGAPRAMLNC